jgi:hypothetical protein
MWRSRAAAIVVAGLLAASPAAAVDVGVAGKSLTATVSTRTGKTTLKSKQSGAGITFGSGPDASLIYAYLDVYYVDGPTIGATLVMPTWQQLSGPLARFKNALAPAGISPVQAATIKNGSSASVSARDAGNLLVAPPGLGGVDTILTVYNQNDLSFTRMCTRYEYSAGSLVAFKTTANSRSLILKRGVPIACPTCFDGVKNGHETGIDCGGPECQLCPSGQGCETGADCQSAVCNAGICADPSCSDGIRNGFESDVDCGGFCNPCPIGDHCGVDSDCGTDNCQFGVCGACVSVAYTFQANSSGGGSTSASSWPGGLDTHSVARDCNVTVRRPSGDISLVCTLGDAWSIVGATGYSSCYGVGGPNGDGVFRPGCDNQFAFSSVCSGRPSCSSALNGDAHDTYQVVCTNP